MVSVVREPLVDSRPERLEVVLGATLAALLALIAYLPHIEDGGWYVDDWTHVSLMSEAGGFFDAFAAMREGSHRPGLALSLSALHVIGGEGQEAYLVIGALLASLQAWLFYLVLRGLRLRPAVAAIGAAVFVVLPVIDSTRLWMAAFPIQVAGALFLAGVLAALHGLRLAGRRAVAWHAVAAVSYAAAILTYELVAGLIVVAALLYAVRAGWRPALQRWTADLGAVAVALALIAPRAASDRDAVLTPGFLWERVEQVATQAVVVFGWLFPLPDVLGGGIGITLLAIGLFGAGVAIGRRDAAGAGLATWAWIAALATVFALAGLVMLLPADPYFVPRISGDGNRTGAFAAFGAVMLLIALIVLALGGLGSLLRRPRFGFFLAAALVLATGVNLAVREFRHQEVWADAWQREQEVLTTIEETLGERPPADAAIVTLGHETELPGGVPVFIASWDLRSALYQTYGLWELTAHPWREGVCGPAGVIFADDTASATGAEPYGYDQLIFVDVANRTATRIPNQTSCEAAIAPATS